MLTITLKHDILESEMTEKELAIMDASYNKGYLAGRNAYKEVFFLGLALLAGGGIVAGIATLIAEYLTK